ncbi:BrnT family toxin [Ferrovum sp.]|uniref:BrnT family toxin n=1 Tax=Ferrovum sp. TaxID=2609467 RepID=UPI003456FBDA
MEFLFDRTKDRINNRKHGISLCRAADFDYDTATYVIDNREDYGEVRIRAVGFLDARLVVLVFTQQGENVRAISLRKAKRYEELEYAESS